jgi:hypothetical protein
MVKQFGISRYEQNTGNSPIVFVGHQFRQIAVYSSDGAMLYAAVKDIIAACAPQLSASTVRRCIKRLCEQHSDLVLTDTKDFSGKFVSQYLVLDGNGDA